MSDKRKAGVYGVLTSLLGAYLRPYRKGVSIVLILLLIQSIANLYLPTLNADLIDNGVAKGDVSYIWKIGAIMLGASALIMVASIVLAYFSAKIAMAFGRDLRGAVFTAVETFSARELNQFGAPSLITRNTNDVQQVQMVLFMGMTMMVSAPITGIGASIMAIRTNLKLSGLILVAVPVMGLLIWALLRRVVPLFRTMQIKIDRLNLVLREQISGVRVIRAFVRTRFEEERFAQTSEDLMNTTLSVTRTFAVMFPSLILLLNASSVAVIWFGGKLVDRGEMPIGDLTAFLAYIMQLLLSVMMAVMMSLMIPRAAASAERIQEVLQTPSSVVETSSPKSPLDRRGIIEFSNVEFRYPGAELPVLSGISFKANPGKFTAIVGSTGSGKSTLLNLIPRFIDVTEGSILLDGVDIREQSLEDVWSEIGLVPQRAFLFGGTIAENLRYGDQNATDDELWKALDVAQASDFVSDLPEKLEASVSQSGTNFSGGQRQRLSIARAIAKHPNIFILDDSFSALDYTTDAKLRAALEVEAKDSTLIVVAQRVSTILGADQIIVLDAGIIAGIGKHHELMKSCETYREIVLSQLSPDEAA
ncbi:MAG: ABC transporter ATP-binding protein [Candidatus Nanopelagicaceae bacterium]|nr:ABC transporter ATP-binding protein [Candidatus Nanopelagicaceae bacterium]